MSIVPGWFRMIVAVLAVPCAVATAAAVSAAVPEAKELPAAFGQSGEFTVSCWIKFDSSMTNHGNYGILYKGDRTGFPMMQFQFCLRADRPEFKYIGTNGQWRGIMKNGGDWAGIGKRIPQKDLPPLKPDRWTMLTGTFAHGVMTIYVDGKMYFRTERNEIPPRNPHPVRFAHSQWGGGLKNWQFPGLIDLFFSESRALSEPEIAELEKRQRPLLHESRVPAKYSFPKSDFSTKLTRTARYEKNLPRPLPGTPNIRVRVVKHNGVPRLTINEKIIPATAMLPSPYVPPRRTFESARDFAAAGVHLYSTILWTRGTRNDWWKNEGQYDFTAIDRRLGALLDAAPEGYIFPRIKLDPPEWWSRRNPTEMETPELVSTASQKWRKLYAKMLEDVVGHIEKSPYAGRVIGYQFGALVGSEWIVYRPPASSSAREAFARFAAKNADACFVPPQNPDPFNPAPYPRPALDSAFQAAVTADVILDAAGIIKRVTGGNKLTGIFYGYDIPPHRAFDRIVQSPLIDFLCAPTSYALRNAGEPGKFTCKYQASLRLHNKLYYDEADIRTHLYPVRVDYRCASPADTNNVLKRAVGYALAQGNETWWFLLVGNETFHDEAIMETVARGAAEVAASTTAATTPPPEAEVAVFCSPDRQPPTFFAGSLFAKLFLDVLPRAGAPVDVYPLGDTNNPALPKYKMYIFLNPPQTMPTFRRDGFKLWIGQTAHTRIKTVLRRDANAAAGPFRLGGNDTDMLKLSVFGTVADPDAEILGTFCGQPAAAVKGDDAWMLSIPDIPTLHRLYDRAGVHIWNRSGDTVAAGRGYVMLHAAGPGVRKIDLPERFHAVEVFNPAERHRNVQSFQSEFAPGKTKVFRLERVQP